MGFIISIVNNKGGVGKSTVSANLADALGRLGKRVLFIDMDSQSNSTFLLKGDEVVMRDTLYELLMEDGDISSFIYTTKYQNVWLLPNVEETAAIEPELIRGAPDSYFRLRDKLRQYAIENFDYTLIDDPPNMGTFVLMSLCASDFALVPIKAGSTFSIQGLVRAVQRIKEVSENYNHDLRFLRLLINMVDRRTVVGKATVTQVKDLFSATEVFETIIPVNAAFESAESARETILRFDSSSTGAKAIRSLAEELIVILESEAML